MERNQHLYQLPLPQWLRRPTRELGLALSHCSQSTFWEFTLLALQTCPHWVGRLCVELGHSPNLSSSLK